MGSACPRWPSCRLHAALGTGVASLAPEGEQWAVQQLALLTTFPTQRGFSESKSPGLSCSFPERTSLPEHEMESCSLATLCLSKLNFPPSHGLFR